MNVLSLNLGSSSLKYAVHLFSAENPHQLMARNVSTSAQPHDACGVTRKAIAEVIGEVGRVDAVGHRLVFGGKDDAPAMVTQELFDRLTALQSLDPLHAPGALAVLREAHAALPDAVHVACFDTAFFRDLPKCARILPIRPGDALLRRYGFHGLSYESVQHSLGAELQPRTIVAHLGNGSSVAAIRDGHSVNTTMAFSPLSGVIMSTRPGDLDPGVLLYLLERSRYSVQRLREMLETQSGVRALSGGEGDLQKLCERSDADAKFAIEMFVRSVARAIGALATELGGVDMLVFTGGIGEHNVRVRAEICAQVNFLNPNVTVRVVESDENLMIARHAARFPRVRPPSATMGLDAASRNC